MHPVRRKFAHLFVAADTMQMFIWQENLFDVACFICACMKLHATLLQGSTLINPAGVGKV